MRKQLLAILLLLAGINCFAQSSVVWVDTFKLPVGINKGECLVLDNSGNVIVNGDVDSATASHSVVIAYDNAGTELWRRTYGTGLSFFWRLLLAPNGHYLSAGAYEDASGTYNLQYIEYDALGDSVHGGIYNSPGTFSGDEFTDAALDSRGNIYMAGELVPAPTLSQAGVVRFDTGGVYRWEQSYATSASGWTSATANAVKISGDTSLYLLVRNTTAYASILCYDSAGVFKWGKDLTIYGNESHSSLALDASGNILVGGSINNKFGLVKLSPDGDTMWTRTFAPSWATSVLASPKITNVKTDANNNIYAFGFGTYIGSNFGLLAKFSAGGNLLWIDTTYGAETAYGRNKEWMSLEEGRINIAVCYASSKIYQYDTNGIQTLNAPLVIYNFPKPEVNGLRFHNGYLYITGSSQISAGVSQGFVAKIKVPAVNGIRNISQPKTLELYPNPVTDIINLPSAGHVIVYDINGKKVFDKVVTENKLYTKALPAGEYFLTLIVKDEIIGQGKFIRQ